jgi:hypothetical protein
MDASIQLPTASTDRAGLLNRLFSMFVTARPAELHVDAACVSSWLAESRAMRSRESVWTEKPPLTSY